MEFLNMLMESYGTFWNIWHGGLKIALLIIMGLAALFIVLVVLFQPGNSSGISALGGQTETFLGKNKSKTFEHKMKKWTVISGIVFGVLCIVFAVIATFVVA